MCSFSFVIMPWLIVYPKRVGLMWFLLYGLTSSRYASYLLLNCLIKSSFRRSVYLDSECYSLNVICLLSSTAVTKRALGLLWASTSSSRLLWDVTLEYVRERGLYFLFLIIKIIHKLQTFTTVDNLPKSGHLGKFTPRSDVVQCSEKLRELHTWAIHFGLFFW